MNVQRKGSMKAVRLVSVTAMQSASIQLAVIRALAVKDTQALEERAVVSD